MTKEIGCLTEKDGKRRDCGRWRRNAEKIGTGRGIAEHHTEKEGSNDNFDWDCQQKTDFDEINTFLRQEGKMQRKYRTVYIQYD